MAYRHGLDFKKIEEERGQLMIDASASSGFPMAVACCHLNGTPWTGMKQDFKKAFDMFVKIEKDTNGYHWAQFILGVCYNKGRGVDQDFAKAVGWFNKSIEQGNSVAMNYLGSCLLMDIGYGLVLWTYSKPKVFGLLEKSAHLGCAGAMLNMGDWYWRFVKSFQVKETKTETINKTRAWYTKAAAQGSDRHTHTYSSVAAKMKLYTLNSFYPDETAATDHSRLTLLFEEGIAYENGLNFKTIDEVRGLDMIMESALSGFPIAVAYCYFHYKKHKEACHIFEQWLKYDEKIEENSEYGLYCDSVRVLDLHSTHWAQYMLGECYQYGYGVDEDKKKSFEYYSLSAEQGNSMAMHAVGLCYDLREETDENKIKAFEWYEKSAHLGNCEGMNYVGMAYEYGDGVAKDLNKAREWFAKAVAQGHTTL